MSRQKKSRGVSRNKRLSARRAARRRGVILLVVLGMLALFTVVVLTFVIVARQHQQASVALARAKHYDDAYEEHLSQAALQVLRGTTNARSVLGPHSLLEDLYGTGLKSSIASGGFAANDVTFAMGATGGGGMMYIRLDTTQMKHPVNVSTTGVFESIQGYYVGRVLTMTSGAAKGKSARITGYAPVPLNAGPDGGYGVNNFDDDGNTTDDDISEHGWPGSDDPWQLRLMPFEGMEQVAGGGWAAAGAPAAGDEFVINGRTFAGPGFGHDPRTFAASQLLNNSHWGADNQPGVAGTDDDGNGTTDDLPELNWPGSDDGNGEYALMPNPTDSDYQEYLSNFIVHANEDYDAVDYQNMLLALRVSATSGTGGINSVPIPSLHRPALFNYWYNRLEAAIDVIAGAGAYDKEAKWQLFHNPGGTDGDISTPGDPYPANLIALVMDVKRKISLRPLREDHPFFNGSNAASETRPTTAIDTGTGLPFPYWELNGPWDVDNDGDGVADSIWVDVGLPVETTSDGRVYKPLMAMMVLDMDGKLNLNFHGQLNDWNNNLANGVPAYSNPSQQLVHMKVPYNNTLAPELAGTWDTSGATPVTREAGLFTGLGLGPQEVSLSPSATGADVLLPAVEFRNLLRGHVVLGQRFEGRYGEAYLLPNNTGSGPNWNQSHAPILAGLTKSALVTNGDDNYFTRYRSNNNPAYHDFGTGPYQAYGSPPDFDANGVLGLGPNGQPIYFYMGAGNGPGSAHPEVEDDGAELSAGPNRQVASASGLIKVDAKFSPADLEWLLRQQDVDGAALRSRLPHLAPSLTQRYNASRATTESWSIPSPSFNPTPEIAAGLRRLRLIEEARLVAAGETATDASRQAAINVPDVNLGIADLLRGKIKEVEQLGGNTAFSLLAATARTRRLIRQDAIAPELLLGLRFNINRPFGNNIDDDGDYIVDEPDEGYMLARLSDGTDNDGDSTTDEADEAFEKLWNGQAAVDRDGDGRITARDYNGAIAIERQRFARQLFTLMMLLKDQNYAVDVDPEISTAPMTVDQLRQQATAKQIAQWCINVADFRDHDSIMTPFEYTIAPFDAYGWNIDGDVATDETTLPTTDPNYNPNRRVVWGCETPSLVFTETLAFHDRRVEDLATDESMASRTTDTVTSGTPDDDDYDSKRMPQGSAFFELYCKANPNAQIHGSNDLFTSEPYTDSNSNKRWDTGEPYTDSNGNGQFDFAVLDLGKMAPPAGTGGASPVWRIAISESANAGDLNATTPDPANDNNVLARLGTRPFTSSLEPLPQKFSSVNEPMVNDVGIERIVWLTPQKPDPAHPDVKRIYYNQGGAGNVHLQPGHYAVVGPSRTYSSPPTSGDTSKRNVTRVGDSEAGGSDDPQELRLSPTVRITDNDSGTATGASYPYPVAVPAGSPTIKQVLGIAVGGDRSDYDPTWDATTMGPVGISISEPLFSSTLAMKFPNAGSPAYYPTPDEDSTPDAHDGSTRYDRYMIAKDEPLDSSPDHGLLGPQGLLSTHTTMNLKTAFLQRLADPTRPYDPVANPYLTVDWMPMDLTVFNGASNPPPQDPANPLNGSDPDDPRMPAQPVHFGTRQRGEDPASGPGGVSDYNLLAAVSEDPAATAERATSDCPNFKHLLNHTLGFLNEPFHDTALTPPWFDGSNPYTNPNNYLGDPRRPFPWLTWNNRPYANAMELLQVPLSSSGRLFWDYSNLDRVAPGEFYSDPVALAKTGSPYGHLLNFFLSANQTNTLPPQPPTAPYYGLTKPPLDSAIHAHATSNYFRLFDFVTVPSPFEGTETLLNPATFGPTAGVEKPSWFTDYDGDGAHDPGEPWEFAPFYAPNNRLPTYREPGKVNINTISDAGPNTWLGVTGSFNSYATGDKATWLNIILSRQGYGTTPMATDPASPTFFANPFRMTGNTSYVPIAPLRAVNTSGELIDGTLLRRLPNTTGHVQPLFSFETERSDHDSNPATPPLYTTNTTEGEYNDSYRNPFFKYQSYQKLGNILTTQSNVYAVWVTVGYFEVERVTASTVHPDGYRLGPEIGSDTGEIKRHRAFYIMDRSIPVAFERGKNHNVDKAILVKRVIE